MQGAKSALEALKKTNYRTLATQLLKDFDTLQNIGNTYTYGASKYRKVESANQSQYNAMRTPAVLSAESRLATKAGITSSTPESEFKAQKYSPKQLSSIYVGQEMTVACFATPAVKDASGKVSTGVHRIDTMDGSFSVHNKTVELSGDYRSQVIESMTKLVNNNERGIQGQVKKLNKFLTDNNINKTVSAFDYVSYLKSGNVNDLKIPELHPQEGKGTKVFEARAMIAGNVCLNRTHGIVYPLFEIKKNGTTIVQSSESVVTLDYTTPTNISSVEARQSALGLSPVGAILKSRSGKNGAENRDGHTTPDNPTTPPPTPAPDVLVTPDNLF